MEQVAKATCIFVQKALKWPKSLVAHVAIATCVSAKRPLQARVRWHDASQVAWSLLPEPISRAATQVHTRVARSASLERLLPQEVQKPKAAALHSKPQPGHPARTRGAPWPHSTARPLTHRLGRPRRRTDPPAPGYDACDQCECRTMGDAGEGGADADVEMETDEESEEEGASPSGFLPSSLGTPASGRLTSRWCPPAGRCA